MEDEIRWLETVGDDGTLSLKIPGLGLFASDGPGDTCEGGPPEEKPSRVQADLRKRLIAKFGFDALLDRRHAARRETEARIAAILRPLDEEADPAGTSNSPGGRLRKLLQAAQTAFALELLIDCEGPISPSALIRTSTPVGAHRGTWIRARTRLLDQVEALIESPRTDIGLPLLLSVARLIALSETLASNQIHLLAPFEEEPAHVARGFTQSSTSVAGEVPTAWRAQREKETEARWTRSLMNFSDGAAPLEARLLDLERAHHALRHFEDRTLHNPVRPESRSPSAAEAYASARRILPWPSSMRFSAVHESKRAREKKAISLRRSLAGELRYGLFTRNCVTELSAALEKVRARGDGAGTDARRLFAGNRGRLSPVEVMQGAFIPEVVALRIEAALATQPRRVLPSTRERALDQARGKIKTSLSRVAFESREFIALTSQTYRSNQDDSRFLLFADGPVVMRPLIGLTNLGYGVAASLFGLLEAPFDDGVGLRRGVQGIAMSIPELFFFQVRQGSYRVAPPGALAPSAGSTETR